MASSKDRILANIRSALSRKDPKPYADEDLGGPKVEQLPESVDLIFAERFTEIGGNFIYCENELEFTEQLRQLSQSQGWNNVHCWDESLQQLLSQVDFRECRIGRMLDKADAGLDRVEALVARTGSILLSSGLAGGRTLSVFPPVQIHVASSRQIVYDIDEALSMIRSKYQGDLPSMISLASGPSRTADIEKTLVLGAHGPAEVYVFLIDEQ
jgi:L-lactate dehydrogenase complex protein LldG